MYNGRWPKSVDSRHVATTSWHFGSPWLKAVPSGGPWVGPQPNSSRVSESEISLEKEKRPADTSRTNVTFGWITEISLATVNATWTTTCGSRWGRPSSNTSKRSMKCKYLENIWTSLSLSHMSALIDNCSWRIANYIPVHSYIYIVIVSIRGYRLLKTWFFS